MADVLGNFYLVEAKDGHTAAERFAEMTPVAGSFYTVGNHLYWGSQEISNAADLADAVSNIATNAGAISTINTTLTKLENTEGVSGSIRNIIKGYFDVYTADDLVYKAAEGEEGQEGYKAAVSVADALDDLFDAVGEGGGVSDQISSAINALDATVNQTAGTDGLALQVTQENGVVTAVSGSIAANTYDTYGAAAAVLGDNGDTASDVTVYGALAAASAAQSAADDAQSDVDDLTALVGTGYGTKEVAGETVNKTVKEYVDDTVAAAQSAATYDDTVLSARVTANENAITLLNKTDGTAGSVKKTVDDAIAAVVASAPSDLDTLKEISDWISGHEDDAAGMNSAIQANTAAIGTASVPAQGEPGDPDYVGPVDATGLHKKIEDETNRATTAEDGLDSRITTLEGQAGTGTVSEQITAAIGTLDTTNDVTIASVSGDVVTLKAGVKEVDGVIAQGTGSDITLAAVAKTGAAADVSIADANNYFTATDVESALSELAYSLVWKAI